MSGRKISSTNPFEEDEDDVNDELFLKNSRRTTPNSTLSNFDNHIQNLQQKRKEIEEKTVESTERSIGILRDSEQIGIATAEELSRQREQLERTDKRLDDINQTLRFSQRHINGIKSVFGSLKNYISGKNNPTIVAPFESAETKLPNDSNSEPNDVNSYIKPSTNVFNTNPLNDRMDSGSKNISARLEENLQEMSSSISRLKGLAGNLALELDTQNELIEVITEKSEIADLTVRKQNKQMHSILK